MKNDDIDYDSNSEYIKFIKMCLMFGNGFLKQSFSANKDIQNNFLLPTFSKEEKRKTYVGM